jgi:hypothetical protein
MKMDEDENENIENLIHGYPFSLVPSGSKYGKEVGASQGEGMGFEFTILNEKDSIECFERGKLWISLVDRESQMIYAYSTY